MSDQPISDQELDAIEVRYNAATPGPWTEPLDDFGDLIWAEDPYGHGLMRVLDIRGWGHLTGVGACRFPEEKAIAIQRANRAFAAHSRTDIPRLVAEVRRMRAELQNAEPVIRCPDCVFCYLDDDYYSDEYRCMLNNCDWTREPKDYCSRGQRREGPISYVL